MAKETRTFVSGVVEGFYGRPWSPSQRIELFKRLEGLRLNTYLYAPKDDIKHRQMWRDLYTEKETEQLKYLIDTAKKYNVTFVYAISPGLDITFSSTNDINLLERKMNQVRELGCEAFSLLFDDIDPNLNETDQKLFHSLANAQVTLTNQIFNFLEKPKFFLFCPTEYCGTRAMPSVTKSEYLNTIGSSLLPEIDIMWTGSKVIAKFITVESILEVSEVLKRYPVIWDNIHANDYDQKRLFLGPYCGRSSKLIPFIRGVLTNPNCEFEVNFVAIHTLSQWIQSYHPVCKVEENKKEASDLDMDELTNYDYEYIPSKALQKAVRDWLDILYQKKNPDDLVQMPYLQYSSTVPVAQQVVSGGVSPQTVPLINNGINTSGGAGSCKLVSEGMKAAAAGSLPPASAAVSLAASQVFTSEQLSSAASAVAARLSNDNVAGNNEEAITNIVSESLLAVSSVDNGGNPYANAEAIDNENKDELFITDRKAAGEVIEAFSALHTTFGSTEDASNLGGSIPPYHTTTAALAVATVVSQVAEEEAAAQKDLINTPGPYFNFKSTPTNVGTANREMDHIGIECMSVENTIQCSPMETEDQADNGVESVVGMHVDNGELHNDNKMEVNDEENEGGKTVVASETESNVINNDQSLKLSVDDMTLLIHLFFLPYEHGPAAVKMLELIHWLRSHAHLVGKKSTMFCDKNISLQSDGKHIEDTFKSMEWHSKAKEFSDEVDRIKNIVDNLCNIPNRMVLYDLYPYIQDMRCVLCTLKSYVMWMDDADITYGNVCALRRLLSWCTPGYKESFMSDDHEPWMFRGGLISEFQRMFPLEGSYDLFPNRASFMQYPPPRPLVSNFDVNSEVACKKQQSDVTTNSISKSTEYNNSVNVASITQSISSNVNITIPPKLTTEATDIFRPSVYLIRNFQPSDKPILYDLCLQLLYNQLSKEPEIDKNDLSALLDHRVKDLAGDRYIGDFLEFSPESCMVLLDDYNKIVGFAVGTCKIRDFLQFRREVFNERMKEKYRMFCDDSCFSYSSRERINTEILFQSKKSIIQILLDGFMGRDIAVRKALDNEPAAAANGTNVGIIPVAVDSSNKNIDVGESSNNKAVDKATDGDERPTALIHIDLVDCCKVTDLDTIDSLSRKLLVCLTSALKTSIVQACDKMCSSAPSSDARSTETDTPAMEVNTDESQSFVPHLQPNIVPPTALRDRYSNFSMGVYCEVDYLNRCYEEFYRRCGFSKCIIESATFNNGTGTNNDSGNTGTSTTTTVPEGPPGDSSTVPLLAAISSIMFRLV